MKRAILPAALLLAVLTPAVAAAQQTSQPANTKLTLSSNQARDGKGREVPGLLVVNATLTTADGKALNGRTIDFYQRTELFGPRNAYIGSAVTDSAGAAALRYEAAQSGPQELLARFAGTSDLARQEATDRVNVAESAMPFKGEPLPLGSVAKGLAIGVGLLGLAVWVLLLGIFIHTIIGIRRCVSNEA
jgi:hypothetical protein